jgi:hypothetical protein
MKEYSAYAGTSRWATMVYLPGTLDVKIEKMNEYVRIHGGV